MRTHKFQRSRTELLKEGQALVRATPDAKFQHRIEVVNLVLSGLTPEFLSPHCGESKSTITLWVRKVDEGGFESLRSIKQTGRPHKLSAEQKAEIKGLIEQNDPAKLGYAVWDGRSLAAHIEKTYSVAISVRQCQRLLHSLGFSLIRPQPFPSKGEDNQEQREEFKN